VPYRIDIRDPRHDDAFDRLIELGALDVDASIDGALAALMPDSVAPEHVARALGVEHVPVSPAASRDDGSVWILRPRSIQIGRLRIVPAGGDSDPAAIQLIDSAAFGTGLHPTTALCLEALPDLVDITQPDAVLDIGTGSAILALAALRLGVPRAVGIDVDEEALRAAEENARINRVDDRLVLARGGPETVEGVYPLVLANVLAAPLIEMAPAIVRRLARHGELVLSGIPASAEPDVDRAYRRLGLDRVRVLSRAGWIALGMRASW
jgi:ribosomal protein L11 methyltransferase